MTPTLDETLVALHPSQRTAVTHPMRPLLLACGPGSGKTRILTHRIRWLIDHEGLDSTRFSRSPSPVRRRTSCAVGSGKRLAHAPGRSGRGRSTGHAFEHTYPGGTVFTVGRNYRSTPQIVTTAARLIAHNRTRRPKPLAAVRPAGPVPTVLTWPDDRAEAEGLAAACTEWLVPRSLSSRG